jgi:hypothetical protein
MDRRRLVVLIVAMGLAFAATAADSSKPWDLSLAPLLTELREMKQTINGIAGRLFTVQETLGSDDHLQTQYVSKTVKVPRDVEYDERLPIIKIPVGQEGFLDQAGCVIRDAPIWEEGGKISISAFIKSPTGESRPFCSIYSGKPFSFFAEFVDRPLKSGRYPLKGGETIDFSCSSFMPPSERVIGKGCTVDVDLWLRLKTNHAPPGEEIEVLQPTE